MSETKKETGTAVATVGESPVPAPANEAVGFFGANGVGRMYSSIDPKDRAGKLKLAGVLQGQSTKLSTMIGKRVTIHDVLAHEVEILNEETGELTPSIRTVLVCDEGNFQAVSEGVAKSLMILCHIFGEPKSWGKDGLTVEVEQIETQHNRRYFNLVPVA